MTSRRKQLSRLLQELRSEGIADARVLRAMEKVPRALFVPPECREQAYRNIPLPIGEGQSISQPFVVALMTEALSLTGEEIVLEIGTGSGYQCAMLAELARQVLSIELIPTLAEDASRRLRMLGYCNIEVRVADGCQGWPERAPFQAILVSAGCPRVPQALIRPACRWGEAGDPRGLALHAEPVRIQARTQQDSHHRPGAGQVRAPRRRERLERTRTPHLSGNILALLQPPVDLR